MVIYSYQVYSTYILLFFFNEMDYHHLINQLNFLLVIESFQKRDNIITYINNF